MKYLKIAAITLALLPLLGTGLAAQPETPANAIDKYFKQYVDDERFTVVYISPKLFDMLGQLDLGGMDFEEEDEAEAIMDIAKDLRGLRILISEEGNPMEFYREAKSRINTKEYEVLMTVRNKNENNVEFLVQDDNDIIKELLLLVGGEDEFILMSFVGNLSLEKIAKLARSIDKE